MLHVLSTRGRCQQIIGNHVMLHCILGSGHKILGYSSLVKFIEYTNHECTGITNKSTEKRKKRLPWLLACWLMLTSYITWLWPLAVKLRSQALLLACVKPSIGALKWSRPSVQLLQHTTGLCCILAPGSYFRHAFCCLQCSIMRVKIITHTQAGQHWEPANNSTSSDSSLEEDALCVSSFRLAFLLVVPCVSC